MTDADIGKAFAALAARLIPATDTMPAIGDVADLEQGMATALNSRPDLRGDIMRGIGVVHRDGVDAAIVSLQADDRSAWAALGLAAASIYYTAPPVQAILGYRGPERRTYDADATPEYVTNGMLDLVKQRGPIWRRA
ncbi:hypothetical protein [Sandarakinorhabdus sp. DWP1-3-1]|uniref:hypothetical protein n=1 Tax=Sandarakinorhabdus sp. DWP1-3-1 TaxID=2804627 RepID=UPI003CE82A63